MQDDGFLFGYGQDSDSVTNQCDSVIYFVDRGLSLLICKGQRTRPVARIRHPSGNATANRAEPKGEFATVLELVQVTASFGKRLLCGVFCEVAIEKHAEGNT